MRMNSGIILQGQQPDIVGSAARGFEAGRKNRLAGIYDQHGAGIASGDKNALAALAQFDPTAAMQAQRGLQVMQHADAQEGRLNRQEQRMIEAEAANLSAQERAAQLAQIEQGVAMGMATQTPQEWDALMSQYAPDLVGQFDNRQMHANRFLSVAEVLKGMEAPGAQSPAGKLADDLRNGLITQEQYDTATTKTPLVSNVIGGGDQYTPGQKKVDEAFADRYLDYIMGGGSDSTKQIAQLDDVLAKLESGEQLTGPQFGLQPDAWQSWANPEALDARERVEEVVQRNLREVLGAQFTQAEGDRLIARAYNQRLSPEQNAQRLRLLVASMRAAADAKSAMMQYWDENNGTLAGFKGGAAVPTIDDFDRLFDRLDAEQNAPNEESGPVKITSDADYEALPSGAEFIAPDGSRRRKP